MRREAKRFFQARPRARSLLWIAGTLAPGALLVACSDEARREPVEGEVRAPRDAGPTPLADAAPPPAPAPPARVCSDDGWCWQGAGLHNASLYAVAGHSVDLWAVGELGLALHFDGERWAAAWAPEQHTLRGLSVLGREVWAVGDEATVLRYVNDAWQAEAVAGLASDASLRGVWAGPSGDVWIVGAGGVLFERIGGVWASVEAAEGVALEAVWASGDDVWAVGDAGTVLRRGPGGWARIDAGTHQDLSSVHGRAGEVWVAGADGEIRRYDLERDEWERPASEEGPTPSGALRGLSVGEQHVVVANELGQLYVWDETLTCPVPGDAGAPEQPCPRWLDARRTPEALPIFGVSASGEHVTAVGAYGSITRWDGETRSSISPGSRDNYLDVSGAGEDVWIAGDRLLRSAPNGGWQEIERDSPRAIYAVQALAGRTFVAGTGGLARGYADDAWSDMDVRADAWLRGLFADANGGWLVGADGTAFGLLNGRLWTPLETPTEHDLLAVFGVPSGSAWAVGAAGAILRHDGVQWAAIPSGPDGGVSADLRGVWGQAEDDLWAVGTGGTTLHWDGRLWTREGEAAPFSLNAVWGRAADDVWAAGSGGTLLHFDGNVWRPELSGTSQSLNALWGDAGRLWAVGEHGTILVKELD